MISEHPTAIEDIVNMFQSQQMPNVSQGTQSWILMEILGAIPEEVCIVIFLVPLFQFHFEVIKLLLLLLFLDDRQM